MSVKVDLVVTIYAADDESADRTIAKLHPPYDPEVLNVLVRETSRLVDE